MMCICIRIYIDMYIYTFMFCGLKSRGKRIRIFMSGDYEFLSRMYGITGAQGTCINMHVHTLYMYMIMYTL